MAEDAQKKPGIKQRLKREMQEYLIIAAYLAAFLLSLTTYRRLILAEYHVSYFNYGWAIMESLILAKVILVGQALHIGERFRDRPLIVATLWQTFVFSLLVAAFVLVEHTVTALIHHRPVAEEFHLTGGQGYELLARVQLMLVAFVPFFAFRQISAVLGEGKLFELFFRTRDGGGPGPKE